MFVGRIEADGEIEIFNALRSIVEQQLVANERFSLDGKRLFSVFAAAPAVASSSTTSTRKQ